MTAGQRILILGCPGSGKSVFARRLRDRTGLPLVHLDNLWWNPDGTHISRADIDRRLEAVLQTDRWILDGDYSRTWETRLRACDTVILLDYDEAVCLDGIARRIGQARPDLPWIEREPDPALEAMVRAYRQTKRPALMALLDRFPDKKVFIPQTREQAEDWLSREL